MRQIHCFLLLCFLILLHGTVQIAHGEEVEKKLILEMGKITEMGNDNPIIQRFASACEDNDGFCYVLDSRAARVYKFSPDGKMLLSFGQRGEGPGEFKYPYGVFVSSNGKIIVTEIQNIVSFFEKDGKFINRYDFQSKLGYLSNLKYVGDDVFYAHKSPLEERKEWQIIFNSDGKEIDQSLFSASFSTVTIPLSEDREGVRAYGIPFIELKPYLIFNHYNGSSAAAYSRKYEIIILNSHGKMVSKITRDVPPKELNSHEKEYCEEILKKKQWPPEAKKKIKKIIPETKNSLYYVLISGTHVFAFQPPEDLSSTRKIYPTDIFTLEGKFYGSIEMGDVPSLISNQFMYILEENAEGDYALVKYRYKLFAR